MCIGIPMQVVEVTPGGALCEARGERRWVDTMLVGAVQPGDWLMTFLGSAREAISAETARRSLDALAALDAVMRGESADLDALFADLLDPKPSFPDLPQYEAPHP